MRTTDGGSAGLSLVELLVAVAVLGIVITAIAGPMAGLYGWFGRSNQELAGTTEAQRVMESVRAAWSTRAAFDAAAFPAGAATGVTCTALDFQAEALSPSTCRDVAAPLKRVTVRAGNTELTLDIARPQP